MGFYDINRLLDVNDDTLGGRLAAARDCAGIDLPDLAMLADVPVSTLRCWEADRCEADPKKLAHVADVLGVSRRWLLTGRGDGPNDVSAIDDEMLNVMRNELERLVRMYEETGMMIESLHRRIGDMEDRSARQ